MKNQIQSVQDYFKNKILNADFTVVNINDNKVVAEILIDGEYNFTLWIHLPEINLAQYLTSSYTNFIELEKFTPEEVLLIHNATKSLFDKFYKDKVVSKKLKAFNTTKELLEKEGLI